ncbi:hypothetical protein SAMN05443247_06489 [Bradyrhizobium erythrophlei]|nr:hypothetical protein SAMN05443247_06489 [Bradyrhizobium erythrophlei]
MGHPLRVIRVVFDIICGMSAIRPISDLQFGVANTEIGVIQAPEPGPRIMRYELTDFEWTAIRPFLPNKPRGVPRVNDRRTLNEGADQGWTRKTPHSTERTCFIDKDMHKACPSRSTYAFILQALHTRVQPHGESDRRKRRHG